MMRRHTVQGAGVALNVVETGPEDAPPILLIHGWSQCHLSWSRQLESDLAERFRLVAVDLRGHGMSEKPLSSEAYSESRLWAEDIAAVITALGLHRPILIGWSMGGWIVGDYLRAFGDANLAGFALVGSSVTTGRYMPEGVAEWRGKDPAVSSKALYGNDLAAALDATRAFIEACVAKPMDPDDLMRMLGFNMMVPPAVKSAARSRNEDYRPDYARTTSPAAIFHGDQERLSLPPMLDEICATLPRASLFRYPDAGHAPFWDAPDDFNRDLAAFADAAYAETESLAS